MHRKNAGKLLIPEIMRRRAGMVTKDNVNGPQSDMIEILEHVSPLEERSTERILDRQLGLSFAATYNTTNQIVNIIYDLASRWAVYGVEIRNEIEEAFAESDGAIAKSTFARMQKLDSFMKESQRLNPGNTRKHLIALPE